MLFDYLKENKITIPPIKCQGIKTNLVDWIRTKIKNYNTWYEPFCGSCVVGFNIKPKKAIFSDNNPHIINFYQSIKEQKITHRVVRELLEFEGNQLLKSNGEHYYIIRDRFNKKQNPLDFLFLNRACFNGLIRFNSKGKFNTPFCRKPNRFSKSYITKICNQVKNFSEIIFNNDYTFIYQDFQEIISLAKEKDLIYCDPPYVMRHADYFTSWDMRQERVLYEELKKTKAKFILSTWHSNRFRENQAIHKIWQEFPMEMKEHFYFLGGKETNRNTMNEALILNT